jgi:hypothetical protein
VQADRARVAGTRLAPFENPAPHAGQSQLGGQGEAGWTSTDNDNLLCRAGLWRLMWRG